MMFTSVIGLLLVLIQCCSACSRNGYVRYESSCYHVGRDNETWVDAMYICRLDNANLAEINSAKENNFLQHLLGGTTLYAWIGLADLDVEGDWFWWTTQSRVSYSNWYPGEPNNHGGEDCALLYNSGVWNDWACGAKFKYICEMPFQSSLHGV